MPLFALFLQKPCLILQKPCLILQKPCLISPKPILNCFWGTQRRMLRCGYIDDETVLMLAAAPFKVRLARTVPAWNVYLAQDVQEPCTPTEELNSYFFCHVPTAYDEELSLHGDARFDGRHDDDRLLGQRRRGDGRLFYLILLYSLIFSSIASNHTLEPGF